MTTRRRLIRAFARLDASPLPISDRVRLELEAELLELLERAKGADAPRPGLTAARDAARWGWLLGARQPLAST